MLLAGRGGQEGASERDEVAGSERRRAELAPGGAPRVLGEEGAGALLEGAIEERPVERRRRGPHGVGDVEVGGHRHVGLPRRLEASAGREDVERELAPAAAGRRRRVGTVRLFDAPWIWSGGRTPASPPGGSLAASRRATTIFIPAFR